MEVFMYTYVGGILLALLFAAVVFWAKKRRNGKSKKFCTKTDWRRQE